MQEDDSNIDTEIADQVMKDLQQEQFGLQIPLPKKHVVILLLSRAGVSLIDKAFLNGCIYGSWRPVHCLMDAPQGLNQGASAIVNSLTVRAPKA